MMRFIKIWAIGLILVMTNNTTLHAINNKWQNFSITLPSDEVVRQKKYQLPLGDSIQAPDGYHDVYASLQIYDIKKADKRFFISQVAMVNHSNKSSPLVYRQQLPAVVQWSVSDNIVVNAKIGDDFIAQVKQQAGVDVGSTLTIEQSSFIQLGPVLIAPSKSAWIRKYQGGIYAAGIITYYRYADNGSFAGVFYQMVSGWLVDKTASCFEFYEQ